jgi:hypothetical protein
MKALHAVAVGSQVGAQGLVVVEIRLDRKQPRAGKARQEVRCRITDIRPAIDDQIDTGQRVDAGVLAPDEDLLERRRIARARSAHQQVGGLPCPQAIRPPGWPDAMPLALHDETGGRQSAESRHQRCVVAVQPPDPRNGRSIRSSVRHARPTRCPTLHRIPGRLGAWELDVPHLSFLIPAPSTWRRAHRTGPANPPLRQSRPGKSASRSPS